QRCNDRILRLGHAWSRRRYNGKKASRLVPWVGFAISAASLTVNSSTARVHFPRLPAPPGSSIAGLDGNGTIMKAVAERSYIWLFWVLAIVGVTTDQASKYGIFAWLYSDGRPRDEEVVFNAFPLVTKVEHRTGQSREPWATRELKI